MHLFELRHGNREKNANNQGNCNNSKPNNPAHGHVRLCHHDNSANADDHGVYHHALRHHANHLNLLNVVRATRDKRCGRKRIHFGIGKINNALEEATAQVAANFRGIAAAEEVHDAVDDKRNGSKRDHDFTYMKQVIHLDIRSAYAAGIVFCFRGKGGLLGKQTIVI